MWKTVLLLSLLPQNLLAQFNYNPSCVAAYQAIVSFKFEVCDSILKFETTHNPHNLLPYYLESNRHFMSTSFKEDLSLDEVFVSQQNERIKAVSKGDDHEFKGFALGEMHLQRALVNLRLGSFIQAALDGKRAYKYLQDNLKQYPDFPLSGKSYYSIQALLSGIPKSYRHLIEFLGFETNCQKALDELDKAQKELQKGKSPYYFYRNEVNVHRAVLMHKLTERYQEAFNIVKSATPDYKTNPLSCFLRGKMALDCKKTTESIEVLSHFAGWDCPISYINYDLANAYLFSMNKKCMQYFGFFIKQSKGPGLFQDTYLKLAWWSYLNGDLEMTRKWMEIIDNQQTSVRAKDKLAVTEAKVIFEQNPTLLKVRLYFDGGYYDKALNILLENENSLAQNPQTKIEFHYRAGRIYYDLKNYDKALHHFNLVGECPFNANEYFVPVAYYYSGNIYKNQKKINAKALEAYNKVLSFSDYPYEATYSYKSKEAIKELK